MIPAGVPPPVPADDVDPDVYKTVASGHYTRALALPAEARTRAEVAYTMAAAITGGLLATGVVTNIQNQSRLVQATGIAALVLWVCTAGLFLIARSRPFVEATRPTYSKLEFVESALDATEGERRSIERWLMAATVAAALATILTLVAFGAAVFEDKKSPPTSVRVRLRPGGRKAIRALCTHRAKTIAGALDVDSVEKQFVLIHVGPDQCKGTATTLRLPRGAVAAMRSNP